MKRSSILGHVVEALELVASSPEPADRVLQQFLRDRRYLGSSDRRSIGDRLFSVLRHSHFLRFLLDHHPLVAEGRGGYPAILTVLAHEKMVLREDLADLGGAIAGHWRIAGRDDEPALFLANFPDPAPLLALLDGVSRIATEHSIPPAIAREWLGRFGPEEAEALCRSMNQLGGPAIRVNTLKTSPEECRSLLLACGIPAEASAIAPEGLLLGKRVNLQSLQPFRDGFFELQDEGSQLLVPLLAPKPGERIVDACAGGGGKTLHCAALMRNEGSIVSVDVDDGKLRNLDHRCRRAGVTIARAVNARREGDALRQLQGSADGVLIDAPCSGIGTFRRNPGLKLTFSEDRVAMLARRQAKLLEQYSDLVKPGGRLVYATCSLLRAENENIVEEFLSLHPEFRLAPFRTLQSFSSVRSSSDDYLLLLPHRTSTDGFFGARMVKASGQD